MGGERVNGCPGVRRDRVQIVVIAVLEVIVVAVVGEVDAKQLAQGVAATAVAATAMQVLRRRAPAQHGPHVFELMANRGVLLLLHVVPTRLPLLEGGHLLLVQPMVQVQVVFRPGSVIQDGAIVMPVLVGRWMQGVMRSQVVRGQAQ